jgi:hypothetical protein
VSLTLQALEAKAEVAKAMDSDGFVMVKRSAGGAGAGAAGGGAPAFESDNVRRKKKRGGIVVQDFYKFQRQESKLDRECLRAAACCGGVTCTQLQEGGEAVLRCCLSFPHLPGPLISKLRNGVVLCPRASLRCRPCGAASQV